MNLLGQITSWSAIAYFVCFSATFNAQATLNNASLSERIIEMKRSADWQHMQILGMELLREPTLNGAAKIDVLLSLSKAAYDSNQFKDALNYLSQLELATRTNVLSDNHFKAVKLQGISNFYLGHYQQAIDFYTRALALAEQRDMPIETANLHSNLGLAYFKKLFTRLGIAALFESG